MRQLTLLDLWSKSKTGVAGNPSASRELKTCRLPPWPTTPPTSSDSSLMSESESKLSERLTSKATAHEEKVAPEEEEKKMERINQNNGRTEGPDNKGAKRSQADQPCSKRRKRALESHREEVEMTGEQGGKERRCTRYSLRSRKLSSSPLNEASKLLDSWPSSESWKDDTEKNEDDKSSTAKEEEVVDKDKREILQSRNILSALRDAERGFDKIGLDHVGCLLAKKTRELKLRSIYAEPGRRLKRVYAMDISRDGKFVVVGGHGGVVQLLKLPFRKARLDGSFEDEYEYDTGMTDEMAETSCSLWTSQRHISWVSDVAFSASGEVVVSSSNDGTLMAFSSTSGSEIDSLTGTQAHHNSGIYSMTIRGDDDIASTAKDGSLRISRLLPSGQFKALDLLHEAHAGVAKCVRWRQDDSRVLATCGNDRILRVFDVRAMARSRKPNLECQGSPSRACNTVAWHPMDDKLLFTCGFAETILLHDLCMLGKPLHVLQSHRSKACGGGIRHPSFFLDGEAILAASSPSETLTQYATRTGQVICRHDINCQPPNVISVHHTSKTVVIPFGSSGKLTAFCSPV